MGPTWDVKAKEPDKKQKMEELQESKDFCVYPVTGKTMRGSNNFQETKSGQEFFKCYFI